MKVPAVSIDITDDGTHYTVTATPWPTVESAGHPYTARLRHSVCDEAAGDRYLYPTSWTAEKLVAFVKKLMKTYPTVTA